MRTFSRWLGGKPQGLLQRWQVRAAGWGQCRELNLSDAYSLTGAKVRVAREGFPLQLILGQGAKRLHVYPEALLTGEPAGPAPPSFLILDPAAQGQGISGFLRLAPGDRITLGRVDGVQRAIFAYPPEVEDFHLLLIHDGDGVLFRNLPGASTCIAPLMGAPKSDRLGKLQRFQELFGGPIEPLEPAAALGLLERVNALLPEECFRPPNEQGQPGGLVRLPEDLTPILIADLHGQVDNLLTVLSHNAFLEGLDAGTACLILMGDAVHSEIAGEMESMDGSMLMMDLLFRLKVRFPARVFFLRGNHDSFSEHIAKGGVPQGLLWAGALLEARGEDYLRAMDRFYGQLPYVAYSTRLITAHAAPPRSRVSCAMLVDIHRYPALTRELTSNRLQRPDRPQGYTQGDIRHFRQALGLGPETPVVFGHTPLNRTDTLWLNAGGIANHHILFSANPDQVGVLTEVGGTLVPLRYRVEPLRRLINQRLAAATEREPLVGASHP